MTSTAKTSVTANTAGLTDLTTAEATDVLNPVTDLLNHLKSGRLAVTENDTHVKHLYDAIAAGSGITKAMVNAGANEQIQLSAAGFGAGAKISRTAVQSVASGSTISWDGEDWDDSGFWAISPNPTRIAIPATGRYLVIPYVSWQGGTGTSRRISIYLNGGGVAIATKRIGPAGTGNTDFEFVVELALTAGDYLEVKVLHDHGSNLDISAGFPCTCSIRRVG